MNIIEYVYNTPYTFEEKPFNDVDSLVLCQLSYARMESVGEVINKIRKVDAGFYEPARLKDFCFLEYFSELFCDAITDKDNRDLFVAASISPRFRDTKVCDYEVVSDEDEQFATFLFDIGKLKYVAFRGTDGTMDGWREDFRMAYYDTIPSQHRALEFVKKTMPDIVGGQSKGGNLAAYAGAYAGIKAKCFDAPGFSENVFEQIKNADVTSYIAEKSVIGELLHTFPNPTYVASDAFMVNQHSAYSWIVEDDRFKESEQKSISKYIDRVLSSWLESLDPEHKKVFVETLFEVLKDNNINTVADLRNLDYGRVIKLMADSKRLDDETKTVIGGVLRELSRESWHGIFEGREK